MCEIQCLVEGSCPQWKQRFQRAQDLLELCVLKPDLSEKHGEIGARLRQTEMLEMTSHLVNKMLFVRHRQDQSRTVAGSQSPDQEYTEVDNWPKSCETHSPCPTSKSRAR